MKVLEKFKGLRLFFINEEKEKVIKPKVKVPEGTDCLIDFENIIVPKKLLYSKPRKEKYDTYFELFKRNKPNMDNYVYIIITNYNPVDFQSYVIKYKSWDKFIDDIQDINCTDYIKGTMDGNFHHNNTYATIDFKDNFHAKYHYSGEFFKDSFVYAYLVDKDHMEYLIRSEIN